ncbi:hypothetical protein Taro_026504 [Colocasia esculenta]|uniref:Uncharacterized protein n=1 Tax=Colocasia esculenta TaxID=4460 RepID=A0A843VD38_COLES|nr:hypothetical protein [Colocasia esculenta]
MSVLLYRRVCLLRLHLLPTPLLRSFATTASAASRPTELSSSLSSSFTVDFLTTSCGLTPAQALSAARTIHMDEKTRRQPESVLALLRSHGFTDAQISEAVARSPRVLLSKAEEKLGPKLRFLTRAGLSTELIARRPTLLRRSLDRHLRPWFEFLRCFLVSAEDVRTMFRRHKWFLDFDVKSTLIPNVSFLLELGIAAPAISRLMVTHPRSLMKKHERFAEIVQTVQDWGVKPEKKMFLHAVRALCGLGESSLAARLELFKKLGWSEEEIIAAFRRSPLFVLTSDEKLMHMSSFARRLGLGPSDLSRQPKLLMYCFDKRMLPRYAVWQVLSSKALIKQGNSKLISMFLISEKQFRDTYVTRYKDKVPELMDVLLGKIKVEGFDVGGEESRSKQNLKESVAHNRVPPLI